MTQPDPNSLPAVALAQAFGGTPPGQSPGPAAPQDSPNQNVLPDAPQPMANVRMPLPVVPHDTQPHRGQAAEYDRIAAKLRGYPSDHPAVASAVDALSAAEFFNNRRARGVVHEWPQAHAEVLRTLEAVAVAFPGATQPTTAPSGPPEYPYQPVGHTLDRLTAVTLPQSAAMAGPATRGAYRVEVDLNGKATIFRNGVRLQTQGDVEMSGNRRSAAETEAPSLLWFGHPNYLEALRFVFRGRYVPASEAGIPLPHILAYTTRGRMVDTRLKADDLPRMEDEQKHVLAMLEFLVRQDFLEMNEVGGVQMLRLSKAATEAIRYYPYPAEVVAPEAAPRLQLGLPVTEEEPPRAEAITTAEPAESASIQS